MRWHRERPGAYASGPYRVDEVAEGWAVTGPGLVTREDCLWDTKAYAQRAAERRATARLLGEGQAECEPVVGDHVLVLDGPRRRGVVSSVMTANNGRPLYCVKLPRGKRACVFHATDAALVRGLQEAMCAGFVRDYDEFIRRTP